MSKLDDILFNQVVVPDAIKKQQVKELFLQLIDSEQTVQISYGRYQGTWIRKEDVTDKVQDL